MIATVTLNPAVDYIVSPHSFSPGEINRYTSCTYGPGGKGVNVSLLLSSLGLENTALGIAAGFSGREIVDMMEKAGCKTDFIFLPQGHSRINLKICPFHGQETDINGDGPVIPAEAVSGLGKKLAALGPEDVLVLAGSVPNSLPRDIYAQLLEQVKGNHTSVVVDAEGQALLDTLPYHPFLVKPNAEELGELFQVEIDSTATAKEYARRLIDMGAVNVVVSLGEKGALWVSQSGESLFCHAVRGETVSTVGAGDSLVAGLLYGLSLHGTFEGALRWGVAAGGATAFSKGIASGDQVKRLLLKVGNVHPV